MSVSKCGPNHFYNAGRIRNPKSIQEGFYSHCKWINYVNGSRKIAFLGAY